MCKYTNRAGFNQGNKLTAVSACLEKYKVRCKTEVV